MSARSPDDVLRELTQLYGSSELPARGLVHVMLVARSVDGRLHPVRIGEGSPDSPTDFFVLNLCRARADAVLSSPENMRREPMLSHALQGPWAAALARYRRELLGKAQPPTCALMTRTGQLPSEHPVWSDGTHKLVLTSPAHQRTVSERLAGRAEVLAVPDLTVRAACQLLRARGANVVSVEAGPTTSRGLYDAPPQVSELWLTEWLTPSPGAQLADALPPDAQLVEGLMLTGSSERLENGQRLRFSRFQRATLA